MLESNNHRDPFTEDPEDHSVIASLVQGAVRTHRQTPEEPTRKRYPSQVNRKERRISFDLDPEIKDELKAVAAEAANPRQLSAVTQALIEYALKAYRSGQITLQPRLDARGIGFEVARTESNED